MQQSQRPSRHGGGRWSAIQRRSRAVLLRAVPVLALVSVAHAQGPSAFTAEDMSRVASVTALDVSEDGRRVAAVVRRPADNETVDHRRYGDPTYLAPAQVTLQVIDTRSGAKDQPFKELVNVRDAAWSRDGRQLAILLARGPSSADAFPTTTLHVWDAERKALADVALRGGSAVALNSSLAWSADGSSLTVALRNPELDREARARFQALTAGPVIVHTSASPSSSGICCSATCAAARSLPSTCARELYDRSCRRAGSRAISRLGMGRL